MSTAMAKRTAPDSTMFKSILDRFHAECEESLRSELNTRLLASSLSATDKTASIYYLTEYQRCVDEQNGFDGYIREQIASLDALKSCETAIDTFLERLKAIHDYEWKQNEVFEQILHELTKLNPSSKEERLQLIGQIDELIASKTKLVSHGDEQKSAINTLAAKSSDTFKNILNVRSLDFLDEEQHSMVGFSRFSRFGKPFFICAASAFLWSKLLDEQQNSREQLQATIRQAELLCQAFKEKHGIPGVSVGVTQHGSIVWKQGFGMADIEQRVPCTPETVMRIASISKTFTITIAGQLVEQGKLSWDDPLAKHRADLPEFLYEKVPVSITVRQLASHTSGIRHYWKKGEPITDDEFLLPEYYLTRFFPSVSEALSLFVGDELLHRPGTSWLYTTHGYTLLSAILESSASSEKEKRTFAALLQDLVSKQLNLKHTKLEYPDELVPNRSRYYCRQPTKRGLRHVAYVDLSYKWAGGGMLSNVSDLLIFANTLLQCRQKKLPDLSANKPLLSTSTLAEMWSPVSATDRKALSYGLGWMIGHEQSSSIDQLTIPEHIFHTGGAVGATSILLIIPCARKCADPRCGICIAVLTNLHRAEEIYSTALDIALLFRERSPCSLQYKM